MQIALSIHSVTVISLPNYNINENIITNTLEVAISMQYTSSNFSRGA
jgi:hypothetical protein